MTTRTFKAAAAALGAALALPAIATVANAEPTDEDILAEVSDYLIEQLRDGDVATTEFDGVVYTDHGLTLDILLALVATSADPDQVQATTAAMADQRESYTGEAWGDRYAGSFAKLTLGLLAGGTPADAEIVADLLTNLDDLTTGSGRISDESTGDWSSVVTQSLAILAFTAVGEPLPDATVRFLVEDQCETGGFTNGFGDAPDCAGDPDATSFAIQALLAARTQCDDLGDSLDAASSFLEGIQTEDGVWVSADLSGTPVANANSTGMASQAFTALGFDTDEPRAFLESLQDPDSGGLRYQESDTDADARASAQALPALAEAPFFDIATGSSPDADGGAACLTPDENGGGGGDDDGPTDGGSTDGGTTDGGTTDDGGSTDGGTTDGEDDGADTGTDEHGGDVEDTPTEVDEVTTAPDTTVAGDTTEVVSGPLARTGSDLLVGLLAAGAAALALGLTLVRRRRRGEA